MTSIFYFVQCVTKQCITKQIIRFSACDIQYSQGLGKGPTLTLIILEITKIASNNKILVFII